MTRDFSTSTLRWAAISSRLLGWLPDTFWNATPSELSAALSIPDNTQANPLTRAEFQDLIKDEANGKFD